MSASTATIASPTKRTRSPASAGRAKSSWTVDHALERLDAQVSGGEHACDTGRRTRRLGVDTGDQRVRHLRADEDEVQLVPQVEVADILASSEQQLGVFGAQHTRSKN